MANTCIFILTIRGEDREKVAELFNSSTVPMPWGFVWNLPDDISLCCAPKHGDGITTEEDTVIIHGETRQISATYMAWKLSSRFPSSCFEIAEVDLSMEHTQRWWFKAGDGGLVDCIEWSSHDDDYETIYFQAGVQLLELPDWVPVIDKSLPEDPEFDLPEWITFDGKMDAIAREEMRRVTGW